MASLEQDAVASLRRLLEAYEADVQLNPHMPVFASWETNGQAIDQARAVLARAERASDLGAALEAASRVAWEA